MKVLRAIFCLVAVIGLAIPAGAQGVQTGSLEGNVTDNNGEALPGVTVSVTSPSLQGARNTVSDANGAFRFPSLPPGSDYTLSLVLEGFDAENRTGIPVRVGSATQIQAIMSLSQFGEVIEVTADRVVVDTTKSSVDYSVEFDDLDKLANNRWYQDVMEMAPGVQQGNNPSVQGQSGTANLYLVDGVDTSDPRTQTWGKAVNFDSIQEVQVKTAGHAAEYGRAPGGIINLVTKSGGNEFHGTFRWVESRSEWGSDWDEDKAGGGRTDESRPIVTFGGPILRDKLWFFLGYEKRDNSRGFSWYATEEDKENGDLSQGRTSYAGDYANAKITWQATPNHMFAAFYNEDPIDLSPLQRGWYGSSYNIATERAQFQGGWDGSLQWTGVFTDNFFMSSKLQIHRQELSVNPTSPTWNERPYQYDYVSGYYYGAPSSQYISNRFRDALLVDGTYFLDAGKSSHEIKVGIEVQKFEPQIGTYHNEMGYTYTYGGEPYRRYTWTDQLGPTSNDQDFAAIYAQDELRAGKLTVNFGLRFTSTDIKNNEGQSVQKFSMTDMIAPRLGFAYDLNGNSLNASIGRFYFEPTNYLGTYFNVADEMYSRYHWTGECAADPDNTWDYPDSCWGLDFSIPAFGGGYTLDPNLDPAYQDVFTLGYRQRINNVMAAGVTFVYRTQDQQIDVYDPTWSGDYYITNVPKQSDFDESVKFAEYSAIMFDFEKRFSADRISIIANYTYTFNQKVWNSSSWRDLFGWTFTDPDQMNIDWYGRSESPHLFKFYGSYIAPWNMVFGINFFYTSGNVGTRYFAGDYGSVPVEERGSYEYGSYNQTDFYIEQPITFKGMTVALYANVFRIFNQQSVTSRQANIDVGSFGEPTAWQSPRSYQLGFKFSF